MTRALGAFAALVALVAFFVGVAAGLVLLAGWPVPSVATVRLAIELHYLPAGLVGQVAACVAWPCLAWLLAAAVRMGVDTWQDRPARPAMGTAWLLPWVRRAVPALIVCSGLLSRTPAWSAPMRSTIGTAAAVTAVTSPKSTAGRSHAVVHRPAVHRPARAEVTATDLDDDRVPAAMQVRAARRPGPQAGPPVRMRRSRRRQRRRRCPRRGRPTASGWEMSCGTSPPPSCTTRCNGRRSGSSTGAGSWSTWTATTTCSMTRA